MLKIVNEGNGLWGVDLDGQRVVTGESYQVVSNIWRYTHSSTTMNV